MLLVTGGAGFIGSNLIAELNASGRSDIVVNDTLGVGDKWRNIAKRQFADLLPPRELMDWLDGRKLEAVLHLGAISDTTASDGDLVVETNFRLSMRLLDWCTSSRTPFIYASSAATYGNGEAGFEDDWSPESLQRFITVSSSIRAIPISPLRDFTWSSSAKLSTVDCHCAS